MKTFTCKVSKNLNLIMNNYNVKKLEGNDNVVENTDELALRLTENGCRKDIVDTFHRLFIENDITRAMYVLRNYRNELQETLDHECKLIDCIDCLIYELETKS